LTTKLRLASLLAVLAIAAIAFGATALTQRNDVLAGNPPDEYSLSVSAPLVVPIGTSFTVKLGIIHPYGVVDCSAADNTVAGSVPLGCYKGVSWKASYDSTIIATTAPPTAASFAKDPAAPSACNLKAVSQIGAGSSITAACADTSPSGVTLNYSGNAWNITFTCVGPGTSPLVMVAGTDTFVSDGLTNLPFHTHDNPTVSCIPTADAVVTKTGPATVNAGDPIVYTVICRNTGPQAWTEPVCADDLPDTIDVSNCTGVFPVVPSNCAVVSFDLDGDGIYGVPDNNGGSANACAFIPAFPGPFGLITNLIACQGESVLGPGASIPVNGSMKVVITVAAAADSCGDTLVDVGIASSNDNDSTTTPPTSGTEIVDPDFLDGVQPTDDNFAAFVTTVGACPVTIVKTGPAGGITGDAGAYTLTVSNAGPSQATGVVVTDTVPAGLTITSVVGTGCGFVGQLVTCNTGTLAAGGNSVITINFTMTTPGAYCNTAGATWVSGSTNSATTTSNEVCFTALPPFNGLVKCVDLNADTDTSDAGECPGQGEDTIQVNIWLCADQATDGIDNNGDSTVDNEAETCTKPGQGSLTISEQIFTRADCDTRNDDDDGDGEPVSNDPNSPGFRPECPSPTLQDFIDDNDGDGNGNVDKNGGEIGEGLGAFEFQLKFDHKIFDISIHSGVYDPTNNESGLAIDPNCGNGVDDGDPDTLIDAADPECWDNLWSNGRGVNCTMTIITENDIRFGCVSTPVFDPTNIEDGVDPLLVPNSCTDTLDNGGDSSADAADSDCFDFLGLQQLSGLIGATITVTPEADLIFRIKATKDNGVVRRLLDENCEVADIFGDIFPNTNAGLTPDCTDIDITIRRLEGDVDQDCDVDVNDAQRIAFRYGSFFGHLVFDPGFDLEPWPTGDFDIDIKDLQFIFGRISSTCSDPIPDNQDPLVATGVGQP